MIYKSNGYFIFDERKYSDGNYNELWKPKLHNLSHVIEQINLRLINLYHKICLADSLFQSHALISVVHKLLSQLTLTKNNCKLSNARHKMQ